MKIYADKPFRQLQLEDFHQTLSKDMCAAERLLIDCSRILQEHDLKPMLAFGSLLGAYRDESLIPHDLDVDLAIIDPDAENIIQNLIDTGVFAEKGILAIKNRQFSLTRDKIYIDFYPFTVYNNKTYYSKLGYPKYILKDKDLPLQQFIFLDDEFYAPNNIEEYLVERYGKDWKTPKTGGASQ